MTQFDNRVADFARVRAAIPSVLTSSPQTGAGIDTWEKLSALLSIQAGAVDGSPTAVSVAVAVEQSDFLTTGYEAYSDPQLGTLVATLSTHNSIANVPINLRGAKKYVRAKVTPTLTGGTNPRVTLSGSWVTVGDKYPVSLDNH